MTTHTMSPADAAWFHMDGPANLAMVTGILLTAQPLDFVAVRSLYRQRLLRFDRFRQRVVERGFPITSPCWEDVEDFDIDQHLHHVALPAPHDDAALRELVADLASTPLDHAHPLWQVTVVDDVGPGSALVMRFHHCIGDGTAMMGLMQQLFDPVPGARPERRTASAARRGKAPRLSLLDKAGLLVQGAGMLIGELMKPSDPRSPLKGHFGARKQVAWSQPVAIADVKAIGERHGAKVNDVLIAAMTGALRHYLKQRSIDVEHGSLRAMVPVDLRPASRLGELGNEFGLVILDLAIGSARRAQRLALTKARMDVLKQSSEPVATRVLLDLLGRTPKVVEDFANDLFGSKASVVMTNVAGPRERLSLTGVPIERVMFWVPHPGRQLGMGVSIMSYCGAATLSVVADAHLVPDPETITRQFNREFEALRRAGAKVPTARAPARRRAAPKADGRSPSPLARAPA
jgi:diacylglycerol O-acyltransferase